MPGLVSQRADGVARRFLNRPPRLTDTPPPAGAGSGEIDFYRRLAVQFRELKPRRPTKLRDVNL